MKKGIWTKAALILVIVALFLGARHYGLSDHLTLESLKSNRAALEAYYAAHAVETLGIYFAIYVLVTALSIPGAVIMTLAGGALFGLGAGMLVVSFASTIGATLAFLAARFFLRDWVQAKFSDKLGAINQGVEKDGAFYLFTLRLIPLFPFFAINLAMGLTPMRTLTYFVVSQVGMLPGTLVYMNAGVELGKLDSLGGILSPTLILSFALLGIFPLIAKKIVDAVKAKKVYKGFTKPKSFDYNMVAIGAGAGGLVTAYISAAVKAKVALIEKHKMGGDCLNTGCVPSKALIRSAKVAHYAHRAEEFGMRSIAADFDFAEVMERVQNVIRKVEPHDSVERYTNLGVDCIQGAAKILSPWEVEVNGKVITTKNITIATGGRPWIPPIPGVEQVDPLTSDTLWEIRELPKRFLVLGGGPIGVEIAQSMSRLGSQVTLAVRSRILPKEEPEAAEIVAAHFKKEGIDVLQYHKTVEFKVAGGRKSAILEHEGETLEVEFDQVLIAVGRRANVTGFGLEALNVTLSPDGTIETDEYLRTNYPNIFACGDVAGPFQLTHAAAHQAWYCAVNGLFGTFKKFKADYRVVPWCTYTDPEVARVGISEAQAQERGIPYEVTTYGIDDLDRAIADSEDHGVVKVLTPPGKDKILGVTIVGAHAGDVITEFVTAMKYGLGLNKILGTIHIYPTMGEANKYLAGNWKKNHVSEKNLAWVERLHRWMRAS